jgi:c-di-GMP-binding flagellar brake protein YcgR
MAYGQQVIFKKVAVSEKRLIIREMADDKSQVALKGDDESIFHLIAVQTEKDERLLCHHTADSKAHERAQKVLVNFSFKNERYFFQSELSFSLGWAVLGLETDLFQLQRRASARIELPNNYAGSFSLHSHAGRNYFIEAKVRDVSAGGIKIEFISSGQDLKMGDHIRGALKLGIRRAIDCELEVRHAMEREHDGKTIVSAGLQFLNIDQNLENRLLSLMMDLQRELYIKYSKKGDR